MRPLIHARKRFYLPHPYDGPEFVMFHALGGQAVGMRADSISCFEEFCLPFCLRKFVEVFQMRGYSRVILETRAEIEAGLTSFFKEGENPWQ